MSIANGIHSNKMTERRTHNWINSALKSRICYLKWKSSVEKFNWSRHVSLFSMHLAGNCMNWWSSINPSRSRCRIIWLITNNLSNKTHKMCLEQHFLKLQIVCYILQNLAFATVLNILICLIIYQWWEVVINKTLKQLFSNFLIEGFIN